MNHQSQTVVCKVLFANKDFVFNSESVVCIKVAKNAKKVYIGMTCLHRLSALL